MNEFIHLQENVRPMMALPKSERAWQILIPRFIEHDEIAPIMGWLKFEMRRPPQREPRGRAVYGLPGAGKSMLAAAIERRYGFRDSYAEQMQRQLVATISMTGAREAKTIYERLLESLGVPDFDNYYGGARERMVLKACRAASLRLLVVDEVQDVLNSTARQQRITLDTLKYLMNELGISIVVLGTKKAPAAMRLDEHLSARFVFTELSPWADGERLRRFLAAYGRSLPLALPSYLDSPDMSALLVRLGDGTLRRLTELLSFAAAHAVETGTEKIDAAMLELACARPPLAVLNDERQHIEKVLLAA